MPVCVHVSSNKSLLFERTFYNPAGSFSLARGKHPFSMSKRFKRFDESIDEGGKPTGALHVKKCNNLVITVMT